MTDIMSIDRQYIAGTYARFPVELVSGKGSLVTDANGKNYIDLGSGIAVTSFGVADDAWREAVINQLNTLQHASNLYYTQPCALLAQMLCQRTGMSKVFFGNSGAEANECAIKAARKYAAEHKGSDCYTIVTLKNSFHGRTLTTLAATGQDHYHELYQPLTPGFKHIEPGNLDELNALGDGRDIAAIMIECVQGEGGVLPLSQDYANAIADYCRRHDVLLVVDEVQTGNGRTGQLYAWMNYGLTPDIMTTAKGLGGGLPIGACLMSEKLKDVFAPGDHGSTFGGNPVSCAGGVSILSRINDELLADVRLKSQYIFDTLTGAPGIESVTGLGLMIGIKTVKPCKEVIAACRERGVLCLSAKDKIRLLPALNIPRQLLEQAMAVIKEACAN